MGDSAVDSDGEFGVVGADLKVLAAGMIIGVAAKDCVRHSDAPPPPQPGQEHQVETLATSSNCLDGATKLI